MTPAELSRLEADWLERCPELRSQPEFFGWEPCPLDKFGTLLDKALAVCPAGPFLDAGCGIGTKCLAAAAHGVPAEGVEREPVYAAEATRLAVTVHLADVRDFTGYAEFGIVYINHPLRSEDAEDAFERWLGSAMTPGAVLITVNNPRVHPAVWTVP